MHENVKGFSQNMQERFESTKDVLSCRAHRTCADRVRRRPSVDELDFSDVQVARLVDPFAARSGCFPRQTDCHEIIRKPSSCDAVRLSAKPYTAWDSFYTKIKAEVSDEMRMEMQAQTSMVHELQHEIAQLQAKRNESTCYKFLTCWRFAGSAQRRRSKNLAAEKPTPPENDASAVAANSTCSSAPLTDTYAAKPIGFDGAGVQQRPLIDVMVDEPTSREFEAPAVASNSVCSTAPVSDTDVKPFGFDQAEVLDALARDPLYLTGIFTKWKVNQESARLQFGEPGADVARLRLCVKMSSQSFSFTVVCAPRGWAWRLYPRDARNVFGTHASKEGRLRPEQPDAVAIAVGDKWKGHKLNFHVVEDVGTVVTIWVEVPLKKGPDGQVSLVFSTAEGARVWYTKEDTGVQCEGGDGIDLKKYSYLRSVFED